MFIHQSIPIFSLNLTSDLETKSKFRFQGDVLIHLPIPVTGCPSHKFRGWCSANRLAHSLVHFSQLTLTFAYLLIAFQFDAFSVNYMKVSLVSNWTTE